MKAKLMKMLTVFVMSFCLFLGGACSGENNLINEKSELIPITFSGTLLSQTKVTATSFETGDVVGLYATLSPGTLKEKRYIDNLKLTYGSGSIFTPAKTVFYPEGDATLDFVCYHPYQESGVDEGNDILHVEVQTDQRTEENLSKSDFLLAKKVDVESSMEAVELNFAHKFSKLKIALVPGEGEDLEGILADAPQVVLTGIYTQADYHLADENMDGLKTATDILPYGSWSIEGEKLVGKEAIILPQELTAEGQSILLEWNGRIHTYSMPTVSMEAGMQCEIVVTATQSGNETLTGIAGTITDWTETEGGATDNAANNVAIHTAALSFAMSDVYRVYYEGHPVADICREYLKSEALTSQAIVAYPLVAETELPDLTNGIVLQLLDTEDALCGGMLRWDVEANSFTYDPGDKPVVEQFYVKGDGTLDLVSAEGAVTCNIAALTIRDVRDKVMQTYPVVKVGTQYWMKEDLRATTYRDGTPLSLLEDFGEGAGYFKPADYDYFFYNGEAVLAGELSPEGWTLPTEQDWETLKGYVGDDAALLKTGEWGLAVNEMGEVQPVNNLTGFSVYANGTWLDGKHNNDGKLNGYWSMENGGDGIAEKIIFFTGGSSGFYMSDAMMKGKDYYKALSIRCIKK